MRMPGLPNHLGSIGNLQTPPIHQTIFLPWTIFAAFYSKTALVIEVKINIQHTIFYRMANIIIIR